MKKVTMNALDVLKEWLEELVEDRYTVGFYRVERGAIACTNSGIRVVWVAPVNFSYYPDAHWVYLYDKGKPSILAEDCALDLDDPESLEAAERKIRAHLARQYSS
jgi:hypothetical protein